MNGKLPFDFIVGVDLAVKGDGPCEKVNPTDHVDDSLLSLVNFSQHKIYDRFIINSIL